MSIFVAFLLASAGTASDQPATAAPSSPMPARAKPAKEKKICKTDDTQSGSHLVIRICKTEAEWQQQQQQQQGTLATSRSGISFSGDKLEQGSH